MFFSCTATYFRICGNAFFSRHLKGLENDRRKSMLMANRGLINTLDFSIEEQQSILFIAREIVKCLDDFADS